MKKYRTSDYRYDKMRKLRSFKAVEIGSYRVFQTNIESVADERMSYRDLVGPWNCPHEIA